MHIAKTTIWLKMTGISLLVVGFSAAMLYNSPSYSNESLLLWTVGRIAGVSAFIMYNIVICMGLLMTSKILLKVPVIRQPVALETHQFTATFIALGLTILHIGSFMFDGVVSIKLHEVLIPFSSSRSSITEMGASLATVIGFGSIAFYLSLLLIITSRFRGKLVKMRTWRTLHYSSFIFYSSFLYHGFFAGSDSTLPRMRFMYITSLALVLTLITFRIIARKLIISKSMTSKRVDSKATIPLSQSNS